MVTSIGYVKNLLPTGSRGADKNVFSNVKMVVFDEADAVFNVQTNLPDINQFIITHLQVGLGLKPQFVLFSATVD